MFGRQCASYRQKTQIMEHDVKTSAFISLRSRLRASAQRLLANADDVNDALQELFVRVWQNKSVAASDEQRQAFMFVSLRNICIDMLRRRRYTADIDTTAEASMPVGDSTASVENADTIDNLRRSIRQEMSGMVLRVFEMYTFDEKDYPEIASELGISANVARSYMSRARKVVRTRCMEVLNN